MRKFDMQICNCGTIHMIPTERLDNCYHGGTKLLTICGRCGRRWLNGADITPNIYKEDINEPDTVYDLYTQDASHITDITEPVINKERISDIIIFDGYRVPMMTGEYANCCASDTFYDTTAFPVWKIEELNTEDIKDWIKQYEKKRTTVNMTRFISEVPKNVMEEISNYYIEQFDFTGTEFTKF